MSKGHRTKPEDGEATRAELVAVAREMFASRGHSGVALSDICERIGVTRGALYHHFPGKDGLFRTVCEDVAGDVTQRVLAAAATQPDSWSRLSTGCHAFLDASLEPDVQQILLSDAPSVLGWHVLREIDGRHGLGLLKIALQGAMDEGSVRRGPVDSLAHVLVGALNEAAMTAAQSPNAVQARRDAADAIDRVLSGIAGRPV